MMARYSAMPQQMAAQFEFAETVLPERLNISPPRNIARSSSTCSRRLPKPPGGGSPRRSPETGGRRLEPAAMLRSATMENLLSSDEDGGLVAKWRPLNEGGLVRTFVR